MGSDLYIRKEDAVSVAFNESILALQENFDNPGRIVEAIESLPCVDSFGIQWHKYPDEKPDDVEDGKMKQYLVCFKNGETDVFWWVPPKEDIPRCRWIYGDSKICYWAEKPKGPVADK